MNRHGTITRSRLFGADAQEIHVNRVVAHGVELDIARQHTGLFTTDIEFDNGCKEAALGDGLAKLAAVDRDGLGLNAVAVDDSGNQSLTTHQASGPLAGPRTRRGFDFKCHGVDFPK